jgi:hypothetical protein
MSPSKKAPVKGASTTNGTSSPTPDPDAMLSPAAVAKLLGVTTEWVYSRGDLPRYRLGKFIRFDRGEVLSWVKRQRVEVNER